MAAVKPVSALRAKKGGRSATSALSVLKSGRKVSCLVWSVVPPTSKPGKPARIHFGVHQFTQEVEL